MVVTPVNAKLHPKEMMQIIEDSAAATVFVSPKLALGLTQTLETSAIECRPVVIGSAEYLQLLTEEWRGSIGSSPEPLAWLFYTSGTTGRSKGAMLSHRNLMSMTLSHLADMETVDENSSLLRAAPMSHGSGLYIPSYVARAGRQVVPKSRIFDATEFLDLCEIHLDAQRSWHRQWSSVYASLSRRAGYRR
jgi:acyl-CoA synthetase (AMP-forming)/AMP-acid ligase II